MFSGNVGIVPNGGVPCKDCKRKGCGTYHDTCPEYRAYREKVDEVHRKYNVDYDKMARPSRKDNGRSAPMSITRTHKHRS